MSTQKNILLSKTFNDISGEWGTTDASYDWSSNYRGFSGSLNNTLSNNIKTFVEESIIPWSKILFFTIDPTFKFISQTSKNGYVQLQIGQENRYKDSDGDTNYGYTIYKTTSIAGADLNTSDEYHIKDLSGLTVSNYSDYSDVNFVSKTAASYFSSETAKAGKLKNTPSLTTTSQFYQFLFGARANGFTTKKVSYSSPIIYYVIELPKVNIVAEGGDISYINFDKTSFYLTKNETVSVTASSKNTDKVRFKWWKDNSNNTTPTRKFTETNITAHTVTYTAVFANVYTATLKGGRPISEYEDIGGGVYYHKISGRYCPASAINYSYNLTFDDHQTITSYQPQGLQTPGGWKFKGWDVYNPSGEVTNCYELGKTLIPNSTQRNLEFVAHWEREEFDITYDFNLASSKDSTIINESELNYLTKYKIGTQPQYLAPTPLRQHYTLKEWRDMSHSSNFPTEVVPMSQDHFGDCQYVATWDKNIYTITYTKPANAVFDTSSQIIQNYTYEDSDYKYYTISLPGISMVGYTFNGWVDTATSKTVSSFSSSDGVNKIFSARFSPNKQIVSCEISSNGIDIGDNLSDIGQIKITLKDGSVYYNTISNIDYDTEISKIEFLLNDSYKKKYEFVSWQSNKINDIEKFNTVLENKTVGLDFDNVYTVILKKIEYKINISYRTLKRDGTFSYETSVGELIKLNLNEKLYFNDTQTMTMVPNKGYIFNGWDDEKKMTYEITFDQNSLSNSIDCTAHFTEIDLTEYDLSMIDPETKLTLDEIIASEIIAKKLQKYNYTEAPLSKIGEYSFSNNTNLEWFCVQTNQIDNLAFQNCKKLNLAMIIPNSDKSSLNGNAFNGCDNLNLIVLKNNTRFMSLKNTLPALFERGLGRIYVPQDKLRDYETDNYWNPYYQKGIILPIESSTYKDN